MTSHAPDLTEVMARLEKVERHLRAEKRRNRWLLLAVGLGIVGVALTWACGTTTPTAQAQGANTGPKVIRANKFILEDATGKPRAMLDMGKDGPMLALSDENGKPRAGLSVTKDGPGLRLYDETGKFRAILGVLKDGPWLTLVDANGKSRAALDASKDGPALTLKDATGKTRVGLVVDKDGPGLALLDATGKAIWSQP